MKKSFKFVLVLFIVFILTGCYKYNVDMEIKDDKSVKLEIIYAMDTSATDSLGDDWVEEDVEESEEEDSESGIDVEQYEYLEKKGYKVEKYEKKDGDSNYIGVKISKTFDNIDDITKDKEKTIDFNELFQDQDKFDDSQFFSKDGNTYKANFLFDFTADSDDSLGMSTEELDKMLDLSYTVTLPKKAKDNNATKVSDDGKTYTWDLKYGKKNEVKYSFELGSSKTLLYIVCAVVVVVIIAAICVASSKKKKAN